MKIIIMSLLLVMFYCPTEDIMKYRNEYSQEINKRYLSNIIHDEKELKAWEDFFVDGKVNANYFSKIKHTYIVPDSAEFQTKLYKVKIKKSKFTPSGHKIEYCGDTVLKIDNEFKFGVLFEMPEYEISDISVKYKNKKVELSSKNWKNYYNPWFNCPNIEGYDGDCGVSLYHSPNGEKLYLIFTGGDGRAGYVSMWVFNNGKYQFNCMYVY